MHEILNENYDLPIGSEGFNCDISVKLERIVYCHIIEILSYEKSHYSTIYCNQGFHG